MLHLKTVLIARYKLGTCESDISVGIESRIEQAAAIRIRIESRNESGGGSRLRVQCRLSWRVGVVYVL